ncbi:methylated-DNA--[protein]-cysteine S-methyltransferase [Sinomicrobium pectinilyticum]|uniref:Methylated-DNA--protein-cysteine methyltransferase n=1 Tax=Sinomicrobium pectinilyticum TaxID=1084421 RepID=A0A3N0E218_SINP1|nr:methylated-DNA--[protein]-cysteine S-methyltransferase [Sinomicrobium pectinilyticum]RNL81892.1 methylated-DNA--[protein]-cysteine S-methyltransferase [Sinomicrobium pectinilyticum]
MKTVYLKTPLGPAKITGDENGISAVSVLNTDTEDIKYDEVIPEELEDCVYQLREYFAGERREFDLKLNPEGSDFQKRVWDELLKIPFSKTMSYLELSKKLGDVKAIRAVAGANARNPLWIIVPCHRVIGNDGSLTGYAGGLWRKKWLLEHESPYTQQSLF